MRGNQQFVPGRGGAVALANAIALAPTAPAGALRRRLEAIAELELAVDLGARIGGREWWRGAATCVALCAAAVSLAPRLHPLDAPGPDRLAPAQAKELRSLSIQPQAYGADTGERLAPVAAEVERLAETPERPMIEVETSLGRGDGFTRTLERAGVGADEAKRVGDMVAGAVTLGDLKSGTKLAMTLGRRPNKTVARPLDHLAFRAKLELSLAVERVNGALTLRRIPIAVDDTPLRIEGRVGSGLYFAARAAGAPAEAVETYLRALGGHLSIGRDVHASDRFDIIVAHRRAATGETETGGLLFAGLDQGRKKVQLLKWTSAGKEQWFDAAGVGRSSGSFHMPVQGHLTSSFGMRFHPLLGYTRMHQGIDYGAPMGSPIVAATDGVVSYTGWHGGHGNFVQIKHAGGLGTGYAHMSRILAHVGEHVSGGQVIGYVGSTGLSTGPHLHFEVYRNNATVNPVSVKFTAAPQLAGAELARFRATLARLMAVRAGGREALAATKPQGRTRRG